MERRSTNRCPICSGPAIEHKDFPEGIKCRNSACKHNHQNVRCPRCKAQDVAQAIWKDKNWHYTCGDCENNWSEASKG